MHIILRENLANKTMKYEFNETHVKYNKISIKSDNT